MYVNNKEKANIFGKKHNIKQYDNVLKNRSVAFEDWNLLTRCNVRPDSPKRGTAEVFGRQQNEEMCRVLSNPLE